MRGSIRITYEKQDNSTDKQIVLDLKGATLSKNASRNLDTSSFDSKVLLVSPYSVDGQPNNSRVVIHLFEVRKFVARVVQDRITSVETPSLLKYWPTN